MRYHFIHVGLGKCMSTTLQNIWQRSSNTHFESGVPLVRAANELVRKHRHRLTEMPQFNLQGNTPVGEVRVLSAEGFSYSFLNAPEDACLIGPKQTHLAQSLAELSPTVLVLVRDPLAWIRSCHAQSIHQGGFETAREFLSHQREVVLENLNLKRFLQIWRDRGVRPVVLPMELFLGDSHRFWATYETLLGVPIPSDCSEPEGIGRNRSHPDKLPLAAAINRLQHMLQVMVRQSDAPDKGTIVDGLELVKRWGARRALEKAEPADLEALSSRIEVDDKQAFLEFSLDLECIDRLVSDYVEPLRGFDAMGEFISGYEQSLEDCR